MSALRQEIRNINKNQEVFQKQQALLINYLQKNFTQEQATLPQKPAAAPSKSQVQLQLEKYLVDAFRFKQKDEKQEKCTTGTLEQLELQIRELRKRGMDEKVGQMEDCRDKLRTEADLTRLRENMKSHEMSKEEVESVLSRTAKRAARLLTPPQMNQLGQFRQQYVYFLSSPESSQQFSFMQLYNLNIQIHYFARLLQ